MNSTVSPSPKTSARQMNETELTERRVSVEKAVKPTEKESEKEVEKVEVEEEVSN